MIKTAGELITEAQNKINCVDVFSAKTIYDDANYAVIIDVRELSLTHCAGGGRASLAALTLHNMGYSNVHAITATFEEIKDVFS